jgi:hypothetical protein
MNSANNADSRAVARCYSHRSNRDFRLIAYTYLFDSIFIVLAETSPNSFNVFLKGITGDINESAEDILKRMQITTTSFSIEDVYNQPIWR